MVTEAQLKAAVRNVTRRKRAFKRLTEADQDREGRKLLDTHDSAAAFFDQNSLRKTSNKRAGKVGRERVCCAQSTTGTFNMHTSNHLHSVPIVVHLSARMESPLPGYSATWAKASPYKHHCIV